jgi:DNA-binding response OmpR family regulator
MKSRVLIIDDDRELCELLTDFLALEGFAGTAVHDGREAVRHCRSHQYDVIILDIMLPGLQGLDVLRRLREFNDTPILMLTARGEDTDRIVGLEMGADDYLPKPCNPRELAARLRAILRRYDQRRHPEEPAMLQVGQTRLDSSRRCATHGEHTLGLTGAEFNLLRVLLVHAGEVVSKDTLCEEALGRPLSAYDRSVDVHISKLRKKLAAAGADNPIVSVRGAGYQFTAAGPDSDA